MEALQSGNFKIVRKHALSQVEAGATVPDINAGVPGADEPTLLREMITTVTATIDVPLCIDTANHQALRTALSVYEGKALVNSTNGESHNLNAILPS